MTGDETRRDPISDDAGAPDDADGSALIGPGGKVDADAVRIAADCDEDGLQRVVFTLTRDLNKRLDKYLTDRIAFMSRNQLQRLIDLGGVTVNNRRPKASTNLRIGDVVEVVVPPPPATEIQPDEIPLTVLFEDAHLIVLNKQADIIVHPARGHHRGTMLNALVWHFRNASPTGGNLSTVGDEFARPGVVHRLDRDTTGVIVFAKDDEAHWRLGYQFENRMVDKRYLALVEGVVHPDVDVLEDPIGPHPSRVKGVREKQAVRHDHLGKPAVTICRVRERFDHHTLVELELKTGRTHQIRVHLSFQNHPIVGDEMYSGHALRRSHVDRSNDDTVLMARQTLHATTLGFAHPITKTPMTFTAPVPEDFARSIALLREHSAKSGVLTPPGATIDLEKAIPGA